MGRQPVNWSKFDENCTKMKKIGLRGEGARPTFLLPATKLGQGNIFRSVCQEFCPRGPCMVGGHAWQGACIAGGGPCMVGGHEWQGACMADGGHAWQGTGGHAWWGACMVRGMHGRGHA